MKKILALGIDYDGCLFHNINTIARDIESMYKSGSFEELIIFIASNRQSILIDMQNWIRNKNGSVFKSLDILNFKLLEKGLPCTLYKKITQDDLDMVPPGTNFDKALERLKLLTESQNIPGNNEYSDQYAGLPLHIGSFKDEKSDLISQRMQELSKLKPEGDITLHFIDDREDLLQEVFRNAIVPQNITLHCTRGAFWGYFPLGTSHIFVPTDKSKPHKDEVIISCTLTTKLRSHLEEAYSLVESAPIPAKHSPAKDTIMDGGGASADTQPAGADRQTFVACEATRLKSNSSSKCAFTPVEPWQFTTISEDDEGHYLGSHCGF
jgi:hypothetical protein